MNWKAGGLLGWYCKVFVCYSSFKTTESTATRRWISIMQATELIMFFANIRNLGSTE
jgi:hypothetical protein